MTPLMIALAVGYATTGIALAVKLPEIRRRYNENKFREDCYQKMVELIMTNPDNHTLWTWGKLTDYFDISNVEYHTIMLGTANDVLADMVKNKILYHSPWGLREYYYIKY